MGVAIRNCQGRNLFAARFHLCVSPLQVATVIVYLAEPADGGETAFPYSEWISPELSIALGGSNLSECAKVPVSAVFSKGAIDGLAQRH
jgi:hypothetical protein